MLDGTNRLHLKITPTLNEPPSVEDYHVPIFTCTKEDVEDITWDLTIEQVLLYGLNNYEECGEYYSIFIDCRFFPISILLITSRKLPLSHKWTLRW